MAQRWTPKEEAYYKEQLVDLYLHQNKTIDEIGNILRISPKTVYDRLVRLGISTNRNQKVNVNNKRSDIYIPNAYSSDIAEFFGIMLGDGSLSHFQAVVTLGTKELKYAKYVSMLIRKIFKVAPRIGIRKMGYKDVYIGSVDMTEWLFKEGLVKNKVKEQVGTPKWIFTKEIYMKRFIRGFFDTDGSVYKLKFGTQISFTNKSYPLLVSLQKMLKQLGYRTSCISSDKVYITKRGDIIRFFKDIQPKNPKHQKRFKIFICVGSPVGGGSGL